MANLYYKFNTSTLYIPNKQVYLDIISDIYSFLEKFKEKRSNLLDFIYKLTIFTDKTDLYLKIELRNRKKIAKNALFSKTTKLLKVLANTFLTGSGFSLKYMPNFCVNGSKYSKTILELTLNTVV